MKNRCFSVGIVGGGIVGLACAYELQKKYPNLNLIVFEKEKELAFHQTGRNSGVIHSGLYYKNGSLKASNCVEGRKLLVNFAKENNIKYDICGKLVIATNKEEVKRLEELKINGEKNGLKGLKILDKSEFQKIEPFLEGLNALWVPETGIIDYKAVTKKFAQKIIEINSNSKIQTNCEVLNYNNPKVKTTKGDYQIDHLIFCGGLFSDRLARKDTLDLDMQIVGFRGDYFKLTESSMDKVKNLIYPVPNPEFPFLGVHFTRMFNGDIECGPNAVFTFKREGYNKTDFSFKDTLQALAFRGTWKLFINHWKFGINEYRRAFSKYLFLKEIRKMIPTLNMDDIVQQRSGVRAMALAKNGEVIDDFLIVKSKKNIHILNAPSPAATACISIAKKIMIDASDYFKI